MITPNALLPEIWRELIYTKLDIYTLLQLRCTSKAFWQCLKLYDLQSRAIKRWLWLHDSAKLTALNAVIELQNVRQLYFWAHRINNTAMHFNSEKANICRMASELSKMLAHRQTFPEISVTLCEGVHSFYVDLIPPTGSPYCLSRDTIRYYVELPQNYPFRPPYIRCLDSLFHPVYSTETVTEADQDDRLLWIKLGYGDFSYSSYNDWCPALTVYKIFLEISTWLAFPDGIGQSISYGKTLNEDARDLFMKSPDDFFDYVAGTA